ncbi:glycosyltransferase family 9 protein [Streptomyces sp. NPDC086077]|uniref:glycosyltransferase family 9 protein n=1 Tax=Streptomyces sp. NPDC086077 TaxID=3154862 RepID=UPI00343236E3
MKALVTRLDSFGDVLLAGPAIRAVAARADTVTLLVGPRGAPAARLLPGVDHILVWDAPWVGLDPPPVGRAEVELLVDTIDADRAVILTSFHQSPLPTALLLRLAGVGHIAADSEDYPGSLLDVRHHRAQHAHEAVAALDLAEAAGFPRVDDGRLRVLHPPRATAVTGPGPYVVLHPGASVPARAWSRERSAEAVRELAAAGHRVVVTGGPDERDLTAYVAGRHGLDLGGRTGADELAGVLAGAEALVTGNTGPAHLAAAVGTPVVSLFSPVVPAERWRPYGVPYVLLGDQLAPCADSRARTCPVPGHPCLESVTGHEVVAAVEKLMGET